MKKATILIILLMVSVSTKLFAQASVEPEFTERPYILNSDSSLKSLERVDAQLIYKAKAFGLGGTDIYYEVSSPKSDIRFSKNELPRLIIKIEDNADISESIVVPKAVIKKGRRTFIQTSYAAYSGKSRNVSATYVKLEFKKLKDKIYEIILPKDIESGEYAFVTVIKGSVFLEVGKQVKISCFGID